VKDGVQVNTNIVYGRVHCPFCRHLFALDRYGVVTCPNCGRAFEVRPGPSEIKAQEAQHGA
jgi:uncharacterized Zn finger protein (UPF0148 family)